MEHKVKIKESEKRDKNIDLRQRTKKTVEHESDDDTNYFWRAWNDLQSLKKRPEVLRIGRRIQTIQTTALMRLVGIVRKVLET